MILTIFILIYISIGLLLAEYGFKIIKDKYYKIYCGLMPWQIIFIYIVFVIFWFPAFIHVAITEGVNKK